MSLGDTKIIYIRKDIYIYYAIIGLKQLLFIIKLYFLLLVSHYSSKHHYHYIIAMIIHDFSNTVAKWRHTKHF